MSEPTAWLLSGLFTLSAIVAATIGATFYGWTAWILAPLFVVYIVLVGIGIWVVVRG